MPSPFTDEELRAFLDEQLAPARSTELERRLREEPALGDRLREIIQQQNQGGHTLGEIWRRHQLSCPDRGVWERYAAESLGGAMTDYLAFHLTDIGCRWCAATLHEVREQQAREGVARRHRLFESSVGHYQRSLDRDGPGQ